MQIALSHETYPRHLDPRLPPGRALSASVRQRGPIGVDVCRLLIATLGLSLYVGLPVMTVAFLGNFFLG